MKVGSLIKYYRTKQGLTQSELVEGICSVPHLSKIEHNEKEANDQTINLLLQRLGLDLSNVYEQNNTVKRLLDEWIEYINYFQVDEAKDIDRQLNELVDFIVYTPHLYLFELYRLRYWLFIHETEKAIHQYKWLDKHKKNLNYQEMYLLHYYHAICLLIQNKYRQAVVILEDLVSVSRDGMSVSADVYYHLALAKCHMEQHGHAIFYAKEALNAYTTQYNLKRIMHTLVILGISYTDTGIYEVAADCFKHLKRNAEILNESATLSIAYHNIGYLKQKTGKLSEAREYYYKAINCESENTHSYLVSLSALGEICFYLGELDQANEFFLLLKNRAQETGSKIYQMLPNYYLYMIQGDEERAINYIEEYTLPYLYNAESHYNDIRSVSKILSDYYKKSGKFQKALQYIYTDY